MARARNQMRQTAPSPCLISTLADVQVPYHPRPATDPPLRRIPKGRRFPMQDKATIERMLQNAGVREFYWARSGKLQFCLPRDRHTACAVFDRDRIGYTKVQPDPGTQLELHDIAD